MKLTAIPALCAGLLAALLLTALQALLVTPLILQAEAIGSQGSSSNAASPHDQHSDDAHSHSEDNHSHSEDNHSHSEDNHEHSYGTWTPRNGWERTLSTASANLVLAIGFALMLVALFHWRAPRAERQGLLWGLAGFGAVFVAPSLGLPPELPGTAAAALEARQQWWLVTALATAVAIALLCFGKRSRWLALPLLIAPHWLGAPQPADPGSLVPEALHQQFIWMSAICNIVFWLALGWLCTRFYLRAQTQAAAT